LYETQQNENEGRVQSLSHLISLAVNPVFCAGAASVDVNSLGDTSGAFDGAFDAFAHSGSP